MSFTTQTPFQMVGEFHHVFGHPSNSLNREFCELNKDAIDFRMKLNEEELGELTDAYNSLFNNYDYFAEISKLTFLEELDESSPCFNRVLSEQLKKLKNDVIHYYTEVIDACADLTYVLNGQLHYIGFNPDGFSHTKYDVIKPVTFINWQTDLRFSPSNQHTKTLCSLLIDNLTDAFTAMKNNSGSTYTTITLTCHMLAIIRNLAKLMNFNIDEASRIVHESNMTKLCYSRKDVDDTIEKYNKIYSETNDPKFQYPSFKCVDVEKQVYMVCNMDPTKGPECAKVLKSINFKLPNFEEMVSKSFVL